MSAILKFDFQKENNFRFFEVNNLNYTKRPNFACDNYIFPKTRGNKNKQWTHSTPVNVADTQKRHTTIVCTQICHIGDLNATQPYKVEAFILHIQGESKKCNSN